MENNLTIDTLHKVQHTLHSVRLYTNNVLVSPESIKLIDINSGEDLLKKIDVNKITLELEPNRPAKLILELFVNEVDCIVNVEKDEIGNIKINKVVKNEEKR